MIIITELIFRNITLAKGITKLLQQFFMINNNYWKLFTEVEVASGGFTSTKENNCFSTY